MQTKTNNNTGNIPEMNRCPGCGRNALKQKPTFLKYFYCRSCKKMFKLRYWGENDEAIFKNYDI